jgi:pyrroloquinoline quinone (PQQ) biosynthesis protein C
MTNVAALNFKKELAEAEAIAAERRAAPELSADEILAGFTRELRSVAVQGFGTVHYYYPLSVTEYFSFRSKVDEDDSMTASNMVKTIIEFARNADGSQKFKPEHFDALMNAPTAAVTKLAGVLVGTHGFSVASAEKK